MTSAAPRATDIVPSVATSGLTRNCVTIRPLSRPNEPPPSASVSDERARSAALGDEQRQRRQRRAERERRADRKIETARDQKDGHADGDDRGRRQPDRDRAEIRQREEEGREHAHRRDDDQDDQEAASARARDQRRNPLAGCTASAADSRRRCSCCRAPVLAPRPEASAMIFSSVARSHLSSPAIAPGVHHDDAVGRARSARSDRTR